MKKVIALAVLLQVFSPALFAGEPVWERLPAAGLDLGAVLVVQDKSGTIYVGNNKGLYKSRDKGKTFSLVLSLPSSSKGVKALCLGATPQHIYAATSKGLYFGTDTGKNWKKIFRHCHQNIVQKMTGGMNFHVFIAPVPI